jgi:hypothetical protein
VFMVPNSLKQLQILVTKLTSLMIQSCKLYWPICFWIGIWRPVHSEFYPIMNLFAVEILLRLFVVDVDCNSFGCSSVSSDLPASSTPTVHLKSAFSLWQLNICPAACLPEEGYSMTFSDLKVWCLRQKYFWANLNPYRS